MISFNATPSVYTAPPAAPAPQRTPALAQEKAPETIAPIYTPSSSAATGAAVDNAKQNLTLAITGGDAKPGPTEPGTLKPGPGMDGVAKPDGGGDAKPGPTEPGTIKPGPGPDSAAKPTLDNEKTPNLFPLQLEPDAPRQAIEPYWR